MSAFWKEFARTITRKPGRFLALLAIVALGAGFYAGLRMTAPDMKISLDDYFDSTNTYHLRVVSTMGLEDEDLDALRALPAIEAVMGGYQADVLANYGEKSYTTRVHSFPDSARSSTCVDDAHVTSDDSSYLNRLILTEGRWPEKVGECLISADRVLGKSVQIGDTFTFTEGTDDLANTFRTRTYTVVGKVHTPYYVSSAAIDASSLGSGVVQQLLLNGLQHGVGVGEVFIEGAAVVAGQLRDLLDGDALDGLLPVQRPEGLHDRLAGVFPHLLMLHRADIRQLVEQCRMFFPSFMLY